MCKLKSAIILKDRIFVPDYDSHSQMLEELGIKDNYLGASKKFVRAELSPKDNDVFSDIDTWYFNVDQDIVPEWFSADEYKPKMVEAVKAWAKDHIHIGIDGLKISEGANHYIKDCKDVVICDSASISKVCGSARISKVCGSASIFYVCDSASISEVYDSASISNVCDSASISRVYGSASISYVCDSASIFYVCDSASISKVYGSASISKVYGSASISYVYDSASISKVCGSASISYVCDFVSISYVCDSASISKVCDSASISRVCDSASISNVCDSASISYVCGSAIVASSPYSMWRKASSLIVCENATFKGSYSKVIYQSGDFKVVSVESGKEIGNA